MRHPLLMLPRPIDAFVLSEQARYLIGAGSGKGALPGRVPYGALVRAPAAARPVLAATIARAIARRRPADWTPEQTVLVAYHAIQWPVAERLMERGFASELWYSRWDRYEAAHDAGAARHELLAAWHHALAARSSLTFAVSGALADLETVAGREAIVVPNSADGFPDGPLEPGGRGAELVAQVAAVVAAGPRPAAHEPVAVSLGHLGRRTDWAWLRGAAERIPELRLLLIGSWYDDEVGSDADYQWLRRAPQVAWLGRLSDADAAAVIAQADVGLIPFTVDPFNDCGLPNRILKYARLGRRTISPTLKGSKTWEHAMTWADGASALAAALRDSAGRRATPDLELRAWALEQTAAKMNAPLLERLRA
ncbi:MAG: hypothetical protein JHD16_05525 [Solirubrobacteraceae bacterium]|nr:hypothetical protein [Solirubrobacteraceae bacterium]